MQKKRKLGRKLMSFLLTLAMLVGLMPGMGLTAYAEGEATATAAETLAPTVDNDNKVTDAKILEYAGKQWYVIASGTTGVQIANDAVTTQTGETTLVLLAKENWGTDVNFGASSNTYKGSNLESQMNSYCSTTEDGKIGKYYTGTDETWKNELIATRTLTGGANADNSNYANEDNISGESVTGAILWPLSAAEVSQINNTTIVSGYWWLRSPGPKDEYENNTAALVTYGSALPYSLNYSNGVRPALCLNLTSDIFTSEKSGESGVYELTKAEPAIEYPLWVGGVQVTSENASNIDGDNKASYDDSTHTLTLNGYSYTGVGHKENSDPDSPLAAIYYTGTDPLTIQLSGTSSITRTGNNSGPGADTAYGIHCSQGNLTIDGNGSGSLTVTGGELKTAYGIVATTVTIKNANVTSMGKGSYYGTGIYGKQGISIQNATVTAEGKGYGISGDTGSAEIEESSSVTALGGIKAISGTVKNSIAGTGWTDTAGTEGQADIAKSSEGQSFTYKKVQFPAEPWLYNIKIPSSENGTVTAKVGVEEVTDDTTVEAGKTVALEVTPDSGYKLDTLDIKYEGIIDSEDTVSEIKKDDILSYAKIKAFIETQEGLLNFAQFNIDEEYHNAKYQKKDGVWGFNANDSNMQEQDMSDYNWKCTSGNIDNNVYLFEKAVVLIPITPKQDSTDVNKFTFTMPKGDVTVTATFEPGATAPTIETQPADLELTYGYTEGSVSVEATAAEDHELSYQWYSNTTNNTEGGKVIEGATKASYTIPTGKNADTVEYYYCVVTATFMDKTATTTSDVAKVTVKKADSSVKTAPKARDITYTGKPQALVEGGTAVGGEMQYALGNETGATQLYTTSIPTATNAGTYTVYYKAVGDAEHNDSAVSSIEVTIAEAQSTDDSEKSQDSEEPKDTEESNDSEEPASTDDGNVNVSEEKEAGNFAAGGLDNTASEVKNIVLTKEDQVKIEAGIDVNVWLRVSDNTESVSGEEKAQVAQTIDQALGGSYEVGCYLDLTLWKQASNEASATKVTDVPNGAVRVTLTLPENLRRPEASCKVIHIHNDVAKVLDTILDKSTWKISFETNGFSTYALVYSTSSASEGTKATETSEKAEVTDYLQPLREKLHGAGEAGGVQTVEYAGDFALPIEFMAYLKAHPQITLVYKVTYGEETFTVTIPGSKAIVDEAIGWYGPLWLKAHYGEGAQNTAAATTQETAAVKAPKTGERMALSFPICALVTAGCVLMGSAAYTYGKKKKAGQR